MAMPFLKYSDVLQLKKALDGTNAEIIALDSDKYSESTSRWNESSQRNAGAIVRVTSSDEVATVVRFASDHYFPMVVQAGGYNTGGASSTHGGIVVSLSLMNKVYVDSGSKTVRVQGGATWADVDAAAAKHRLAVVGGTVNHVGVGGSALGGGYGWLTGQYGLAIDNLLRVTMVLATGRVVVASATQNPDLFWAVRGAGQDFGVVTEFVFQAHPQENEVFGGRLLFRADKLPKIVEFANQFEQLNDGRQAFFVTFTNASSLSGDETVVEVMTFCNKTRAEAERFFSPLLSLNPALDETDTMPYPEINTKINKDSMAGSRKRMSGTNFTLPLDVQFVQQIYRDFTHIMECYAFSRDSFLAFKLIPYTQIIKVSNDATAFASRGRYYDVQSVFCWSDTDLDTKVPSIQGGLLSKIEEHAGINKHRGSHDGIGAYANFVEQGKSAHELFGDNYTRLRELKLRYDPNNMFRKWHDILWNVDCHGVHAVWKDNSGFNPNALLPRSELAAESSDSK